jgi:hypothetical protein
MLGQAAQQIAQKRLHDFRLLAVDDSTGRLSNAEEIQQPFGRPRSSGVSLARF